MNGKTHKQYGKSVLFLLGATGPLLVASLAAAHGTVTSPPSRIYGCYQEGPESPDSAACRAAVAAMGSGPLYDWNGVRQGNAGGNHRAVVPDGQLCSGGNPGLFGGLDLARSDWPATAAAPGPFTFRWTNTAPHRSNSYNYYITRADHDPSRPLRWSDLELLCSNDAGGAAGGGVSHTCTLPSRSGRHVVYAVWQRSDSPEAFYACVDLVFGGGNPPGGDGGEEPPTDPQPEPDPGEGHCHSPHYRPGRYEIGDVVQHRDQEFQCKVGGWCSQDGPYEPGVGWAFPEAWTVLASCSGAALRSSTSALEVSLGDEGANAGSSCSTRPGATLATSVWLVGIALTALGVRRRRHE